LLSGEWSSVSHAGPGANGIALRGSNEEEDDDPIGGGAGKCKVDDFPPELEGGAGNWEIDEFPNFSPGVVDDDDGFSESEIRGSWLRFRAPVRGSGGAESCK
jgi:hypothetical protein